MSRIQMRSSALAAVYQASGIPYTWTRIDDFVHTGMDLYVIVLVCESTALSVLVCTGIYRYVPNRYFQNMVYSSIHCIKALMGFHPGGIDLRLIHGGLHFPRTVQHILVLQVQTNPFSSKRCTNNVYTFTQRYILSCTHTHKGHNHFSLRIRPYPPCDADEFPIHAPAFHRVQHPSSPQYPPSSDHPDGVCRAQTATARG
jgi:hypothetical protein